MSSYLIRQILVYLQFHFKMFIGPSTKEYQRQTAYAKIDAYAHTLF